MGETYQLASWTTHPYTGIRKRNDHVEHRVRVLVYDPHDCDVVHEVRHVPAAEQPGDWVEKRVVEFRGGHTTMHRKEVPHLT